MSAAPVKAGRRWAYAGITLGGAVSVAANVAHSFVPPPGAPAGWRPHAGAVIGAIVWPVFLFIAIEILARTAWPHGWRWWLLRFGGLLPVAAVAAIVSYRHLSGLLAFYGEDRLVVVIGPAAVDGLMVMATGALLAGTRHTHTAFVAEPANEPVGAESASTHPGTASPAEPAPTAAVEPAAVPAHLIPTARFAVTNHEVTTGQPITADQLATRMSIPTDTARRLLAQLRDDTTPAAGPARVNGASILQEAQR